LLKPLVFTGESDTPPKSRDRYEKTAAIVTQWHIGNIWDVHSKARKYLHWLFIYFYSVITVTGYLFLILCQLSNRLNSPNYVSIL
jgi:hypothetical protein